MEGQNSSEYSQPGENRLFVHEFDGIQEYDNPLPGWWKAIFWVSIVFAVVYFIRFQIGPGTTVKQAYDSSMKEVVALQRTYQKKVAGQSSAKVFAKMAGKPEVLAAGKAVFMEHCALCHGSKGEGKIGPNLTDSYWVFGPAVSTIFAVIQNGGREGKGMVSWQGKLKLLEMQQVAMYVKSLQGSKPAGGLPPNKSDEKYHPPSK